MNSAAAGSPLLRVRHSIAILPAHSVIHLMETRIVYKIIRFLQNVAVVKMPLRASKYSDEEPSCRNSQTRKPGPVATRMAGEDRGQATRKEGS